MLGINNDNLDCFLDGDLKEGLGKLDDNMMRYIMPLSTSWSRNKEISPLLTNSGPIQFLYYPRCTRSDKEIVLVPLSIRGLILLFIDQSVDNITLFW